MLLILVISFLLPASLKSQNSDADASFLVGEKVEVWKVIWYPANVVEIKNGSYKVHYQDWLGYPDEWVNNDRIKKFGSSKEYKAKAASKTTQTATASSAKPEMIAGIPKIVGTSWAVVTIYKKGTTPTFDKMDNYIFCNSGDWEFLANYVTHRGNYKVQGNQLTITESGNKPSTYKMTWNDATNYLELDDAVMIIRLKYNMKTTC